MTHEELAANSLLLSLPEKVRTALQTIATRRRVPITTLMKEGLLKVADDINANNPPLTPTRSAGYKNANAV